MVFAAGIGGLIAAFTETGAAPAGIIESIQQVEFTIASSATSGTTTISSVDTAKTAIFFSHHILGGRRQTNTSTVANDAMVRVDLTNGTTVTATRGDNPAFAITVVCTVVEFTSAAVDSIQQGSIQFTGTTTSNTDTISSVDTARSVVVHNGVDTSQNASIGGSAFTDVVLTNATTVTATRDAAGSATINTNYVVIEFAAGIVDSVQPFSVAITSGTTNTATITSVDTAISMIFPGGMTLDSTSMQGDDDLCYAELTNGTTVTATRNTASAQVPVVTGTVVEFASGKIESIQRGVDTIAASATTEDVTVSSVVVAQSTVNALGATSNSGSAFDPEEQTFTIEILNSTTIRATRDVGSSRTVIFSWELAEFAV